MIMRIAVAPSYYWIKTPQFRSFSKQVKCNDEGKSCANDSSEAAAMDGAMDFLNQAKGFVDDINEYSQFQEKVMNSTKPVILVAHAAWSAPCRKLLPRLEKQAVEKEGKFKLVKLDINTLPELCKGLNIKNVPTMLLVHKGNVIDQQTGVPTTQQLMDFIDTTLLVESIGHNETVMETLMEKAEQFLSDQQFEPAKKMLLEGYSYETWRDQYGARIQVGLALCELYGQEDQSAGLKKTKEILSQVTDAQRANLPELYKGYLSQIQADIAHIETMMGATNEEVKLTEQIDSKPGDLELRLKLALLQFEKGRNAEAIESCLQIIAIDRNWNNKAANELLLKVFNKVGASNELVITARKKLSKILF